mgnify:CR=1 FL=1
MALIDKTFALSSKWRDYLMRKSESFAFGSSDLAVAKAQESSPTEKPTLKSINDYLKTRSDLLPTCRRCDKKIDKLELAEGGTMRFRCHGAFVDEYISDSILRNQERMYDYLATLKDKKVFQSVPQSLIGEQLPTMVSSSTRIIWTSQHESMLFGGALTKTVIPKPKTPPRLAPILSAKRVARAITFED